MDLMDFVLIFLAIFIFLNWNWFKCMFDPVTCATDKITGTFGGIVSFFSDIGTGFNQKTSPRASSQNA